MWGSTKITRIISYRRRRGGGGLKKSHGTRIFSKVYQTVLLLKFKEAVLSRLYGNYLFLMFNL